jgi:AbrB family looped-hinge helix DNA binding protein
MTGGDSLNAKIDSKGRILLPPSLRDQLGLEPGDVVSLKPMKGSVLLTGDYASKFKRMLATPPTRLGKPSNVSPSKMKKIWKTG